MSASEVQNQLRLSNLQLSSQLMQGTYGAVSQMGNSKNTLTQLNTVKSQNAQLYAVKGDSKYKTEYDSNKDGKITYNEYIKYVSDSISSKNNIPISKISFRTEEDYQTGLNQFNVINMKKILWSYLNSSINLPAGLIEEEA